MSKELRKINQLKGWAQNPRAINKADFERLKKHITEHGQMQPLVITPDGDVLGGNMRLKAYNELGIDDVWVEVVQPKNEADKLKIALVLNDRAGYYVEQDLAELIQNYKLDINFDDYKVDLAEGLSLNELMERFDGGLARGKGRLADLFIMPPFSVFNARAIDWMERKQAWLNLGIKSELGREGDLLFVPGDDFTGQRIIDAGGGTSIFDPVLCELIYKWFCPPGGEVLDPFAGGSVRAVVAGFLGYNYTGIDLIAKQIEANIAQVEQIIPKQAGKIGYITGDSNTVLKNINGSFDLIFSCPPYVGLEKYSDDPLDLSNMEYGQFLTAYRAIIEQALRLLNPQRFAVFVVGEVRDKTGNYYNFVGDTIRAFTEGGAHYYNEAILVTPIGSLPLRVGRQFKASRKLGKTHQNILIFYKGDSKKIKDNFSSDIIIAEEAEEEQKPVAQV